MCSGAAESSWLPSLWCFRGRYQPAGTEGGGRVPPATLAPGRCVLLLSAGPAAPRWPRQRRGGCRQEGGLRFPPARLLRARQMSLRFQTASRSARFHPASSLGNVPVRGGKITSAVCSKPRAVGMRLQDFNLGFPCSPLLPIPPQHHGPRAGPGPSQQEILRFRHRGSEILCLVQKITIAATEPAQLQHLKGDSTHCGTTAKRSEAAHGRAAAQLPRTQTA